MQGECFMSTVKLTVALIAVFAFSAIGVATASAVETLWKGLPGTAGETFTTSTSKPSLEGLAGSRITCVKAKGTGELLKEGTTEGKDATLALTTVTLEGCKAESLFPINSLGDAKEVILGHGEIHACMIKPGDFGLLLKPLPIHLEVPAVGLLILIEGAVIGLAEATADKKVFQLHTKQSKGVQEFSKCEGGTAQSLTMKDDAAAAEDVAVEVAEGTLTFAGTKDNEGETMMEK
jgi:hypothetical protein